LNTLKPKPPKIQIHPNATFERIAKFFATSSAKCFLKGFVKNALSSAFSFVKSLAEI
jgi:hypothetical protein